MPDDAWFRALKKLTLVLSKFKELGLTVNLGNFKLQAVAYFSYQDNDEYPKAIRQRELRPKATANSTANSGHSGSVSGSSSAILAHLCGRNEDMATRSLQSGEFFVV